MAIITGTALFSSTKVADMKFGAPGSFYVVFSVTPEVFADAEALGLKCKRNVYR